MLRATSTIWLVLWTSACLAAATIAFVPSPPLWLSGDGPTIMAPSRPKPPKLTARADDAKTVAQIVDRPIFNAGRTPDPKPGPAAAAAAAVSSPPPIGDLSKVRLTGIVSHPGGGLAFLLKSDGQATVLTSGSNIDGWTIKSIDTLGVHLEGQGQTSTLRLPAAENRAQNNPQTNAP